MAHTLNDYISLLEREGLLAAPVPADLDREQPIALVSCDSRTVVPGTLFVCKGAHFKAEFLDMAQSRGAVAYASEKRWPDSPLPCILLSDLRRAMALMADLCYDHPSGKLKVVGFTGTKGKSSATYYLKSVLDVYRARQGKGETGVISSIDTYDGAERFESHLTTPEPLDLQRHLAHAAQAGLEYLTMEVSSQALKYHRSLCTEFAAACFLNIGYDHISPIEHPDFEDYFASKLKIFDQAQVNCVNLDCDHAPEVLAAAQAAGKPVITFSQKNPQADVYASSVRKEDGQTVFQVRTPSYEREFRLTMPGLFNVENALGVIAVCEALRIPDWAVYDGLVRARVPGRMEVFSNADGSVQAIVDYAHNRLSFETLFRSVREEYPGRNMAIVFGCPGKKAFDRRHDLGEAAGQWCDRVYLTEEDSGEEDTLAICREIAPNVEKEGCPVQIIPNRGEAIRRAVLDSQWPSILLLTGKGRETRQKRGIEYIDTPTDVEYVQAFLQEYDLIHRLDPSSPAKAALSVLPALEERQGETWVVYAPPEGLSALLDGPALARAGARVVLVRPPGRRAAPRPVRLRGGPVRRGRRPPEAHGHGHQRAAQGAGHPAGRGFPARPHRQRRGGGGGGPGHEGRPPGPLCGRRALPGPGGGPAGGAAPHEPDQGGRAAERGGPAQAHRRRAEAGLPGGRGGREEKRPPARRRGACAAPGGPGAAGDGGLCDAVIFLVQRISAAF